MAAIRSSEKSILTRATRRNIAEYDILDNIKLIDRSKWNVFISLRVKPSGLAGERKFWLHTRQGLSDTKDYLCSIGCYSESRHCLSQLVKNWCVQKLCWNTPSLPVRITDIQRNSLQLRIALFVFWLPPKCCPLLLVLQTLFWKPGSLSTNFPFPFLVAWWACPLPTVSIAFSQALNASVDWDCKNKRALACSSSANWKLMSVLERGSARARRGCQDSVLGATA
jgi:hypothetical protein